MKILEGPARNELPPIGIFYSAANPNLPPAPGNIWGLQGWSLGSGCYLIDDLGGIGPGGGFHAMDGSGPAFPGGGSGGGGDVTNLFSYSPPTNGLWLQITNVSNGSVYANIHGGTDFVYAVLASTNLAAGIAATNWNIETEVFPGINTNTMPFSVLENGRNPLFLWAMDWTGTTSSGNQTPLWWLYYYFGVDGLGLSDTDLDSSGVNDLLSDYQTGFDPNVIQFSLSVTNQYVTAIAPIQLSVNAGQPFYVAVLVDDTNLADANWRAYTTSTITVDLGSAQGWHNVSVGLRGRPPDASPTWLWQHLFLVSPPVLTITNPTTFTVDEPIVQIYGYCQESLASISYDLSNASGFYPNQPSDITDQCFDTNAFGITTNYFECLDVPLTNGLNAIIMHATDLAGETTTTNFYFTVDYSSKTNPPALQITWPRNGAQVSGGSFICFGSISDPTATINVSTVATNGDGAAYTNMYPAEVGRDGSFSIENIPLSSGANPFMITAQDVVGNTAITNISIVQTNFCLSINPVAQPLQLWQSTVSLTGTISDPTYAVWVNGVKGTNNGDGTWSANNVPTENGNFAATAYAPNEQQPNGSYGN